MFQPGQSGNPAGRPKGARHRITLMAEKLMEDDAEAVVQSVVAAAKDGDMVAARLVLERIAAPRKGRTVAVDLPAVKSAQDMVPAIAAVVAAVAEGELTPGEGQEIAAILETQRKAIESADLERRIAALEQQQAPQT
jgi:Family of unknown function (DUF5681)